MLQTVVPPSVVYDSVRQWLDSDHDLTWLGFQRRVQSVHTRVTAMYTTEGNDFPDVGATIPTLRPAMDLRRVSPQDTLLDSDGLPRPGPEQDAFYE